jgi:protein-S-isoprenylcysteine O-methyltransferase Ste14
MPTTALIVCLTMGLMASVGRSALQYFRTGDFGLRFRRGATRSERIALALVVIGVLGAPLACAVALSGTKTGRLLLNSGVTHGLGLTLMATGGLLTLIAQIHMAESWRIGVDTSESTALVTSGVFRLIRHPIYTGVLTAVSGLALATMPTRALPGVSFREYNPCGFSFPGRTLFQNERATGHAIEPASLIA